jgi:hypothetical protein
MSFNYVNNYHQLPLKHHPSFEEVEALVKEYYIVQTVDCESGYVIIPELTTNGKINRRVI